MSGQPPTIRLYYKPEIPWEQIDDQIQSGQSRGAIILNIFQEEEVPAEERGYECYVHSDGVYDLIQENVQYLAKVTRQGEVSDEIRDFIDNGVPQLIKEAQAYQ
ncbi:hypothetical protein K492DRAFT_234677 [Lichtheimia hyalospora FSU 10163]|nr:hypothetical protein K492DRAFT_234677 [Lichtheimia hyalospora FSU 10163]